jgi:hypothetical protein
VAFLYEKGRSWVSVAWDDDISGDEDDEEVIEKKESKDRAAERGECIVWFGVEGCSPNKRHNNHFSGQGDAAWMQA